jgi:methanogenic corrinoid protein MtbC1
VLGLSCLLTSGYEALRETIESVRAQSASWHPHLPIVIGGAAVDAMVKDRTGADAWCDDAARGLGVVRALLR